MEVGRDPYSLAMIEKIGPEVEVAGATVILGALGAEVQDSVGEGVGVGLGGGV